MAVAIDFFSGVGGLSYGLSQAGFDVALDVEIEDIAGRYAQYNLPASKVLFGNEEGDIRKFSASNVDYLEVLERYGEIDLVAGGPPCQGFSLAGKKNKDDPLNDLVLEFARVIEEIKPKSFLIENVPGMKIGGSERLKKTVDLLSKNYAVTDAVTLNAWDFGVPQTRRRVFIIGYRRDLGVSPSLPQPSHVFGNSGQNNLFLKDCPSVWDAISDLPDCDLYKELLSGDRIEYTKHPETNYQSVMRGDTRYSDDMSYDVEWDKNICTNLRRTQHGDDLLARFAEVKQGQSDKKSSIRRLVPNDLSTTIRAGTTSDRGSWSAPRPLHPFLDRVITTRECARIQSFPDFWTFHPSKWHGNRMVGNAVPPLLAKAVGKKIIEDLQLSVSNRSNLYLRKDFTLVEQDIEDATNAGYEHRKVSQYVASWKGRV